MNINANRSILASLPRTAALFDIRSGCEFDADRIREMAQAKAILLAGSGLAHGDRVVIAEAAPVDYLVAIFACWISGFTAVVVNPALAAEEQENVIASTGAMHFLGDRKLPGKRTAQDAAITATHGDTRHPGFDEPALVLMTSGTTGVPKGIVHSMRSLTARIALNIAAIGRAELAETLCVLPVFFGHGLIGNILTPLFAGGRVHLWTTPGLAELRQLGKLISSRRISFMSSVPSFWKLALRVADRPEIPLSRVHIGSAPLSLELWQEVADWGRSRNVLNMFGMSETANWIGGGLLDEADGRDGFVGRAWGGSIGIRDDRGEIAFAGRGEVVLQSPSMMLGYWRRPELDHSSFSGTWFRTGDIGEIDDGGCLTLVGRTKSEINRAGIKILAEEIDLLLERHEDVLEACAFGIPDPVSGEAVAAAVVLRQGVAFDPEAIKAWCRERARPDAVPVRLRQLGEMPRNDRGKVMREMVRRAVEDAGT